MGMVQLVLEMRIEGLIILRTSSCCSDRLELWRNGGNVLRIGSHRLGRPDFMERDEEDEVGAQWCGGMTRHS